MPIETCSVDKPKPINTGPSQAEGIAKFACRVKHADLTAELFDLGGVPSELMAQANESRRFTLSRSIT